MDVGSAEGIDRPRTYFPNGHSVKDHVFGLVVPHGNDRINYEKSYDFHCAETPTSWTVNVTFVRHSNQNVTCLTYIKRNDNGPRLVSVQFWVAIHMNTNCFDVSYAQHFISRISAGRVDRQATSHVIMSSEANRLEEVEFRVQFLFIVHGCHSIQYTIEGSGGTEETMSADTTDRDFPTPKKRHLKVL
ncbi:unnamed protein product [Larinioides sclopetarius]|uniref:Uncharacterized protein n=1 Tax=Larinioides sclopetarius TaxID=280406 RepID=A0AAV2ACL8_9ARAC